MKINFKKLIIVTIILILLFALSFLIIKGSEKTPQGLIILSGRIEGRETNVSPKIQGRIIKLYKDEGDSVRQGELLCEIDSEQLSARYKAAVETREASYSAIAQAMANLMKLQMLNLP
ncbi:hypothetical protein [Thermodesulfovibrio sp. TK110]